MPSDDTGRCNSVRNCISEHLIVGRQYLKLRAAVDLVGHSLVFFAEGFYEVLVEHSSLGKLRKFACQTLGDNLGARLSIALKLEAVRSDSGLDEIVYDRLGAAARKIYVIFFRPVAVSMRCHLHSDVRIVIEQSYKFVESRLRFRTQCGLVVVIEDVLEDIGLVDRREYEIYVILRIFLSRVRGKLLAGIEVSFRAGKHHISHAALQRK